MNSLVAGKSRSLLGLMAGLVVVAAVGFAPLGFQAYGIVLQVYVLAGAAVSWNVIGGYAGQLSLGHAASFGIGAYTAAWLTYEHSAPLLVTLPAAMAVSCLVSVVLLPCFRARGAYFAILTLAFAAILAQLAREYAPNANSGLLFDSFAVTSRAPLQLLTIGLLVLLVLVYVLMRTRFGLALRAIRLDLDAARAVGVDDFRMRTVALLLASLANGYFGAVYASDLGFIDPDTAFNLTWSITPVLAAILGGTATVFGPIAGAAVWIGISEVIALGDLSGGAPLALQGAALVLITIGLPNGLAGIARSIGRRLGGSGTSVDDGPPPSTVPPSGREPDSLDSLERSTR